MLGKKEMMGLWENAMAAKNATKAAIWDDCVSEEEFDAMCDREDDALESLQRALVQFCHGAIGEKEAYMLAHYRTEDIGKTLARMA